MKIKLTPELAYLIGFWKKRKTREGIGVKGEDEFLHNFADHVLKQELSTPDKILTEKNRVYFYHSAYRKFFQQIEEEQLERFKYLNEYAANFVAGMFDSAGKIDKEKGIVYFEKASKADEMLLLRLGFAVFWKNGKLIVGRPKIFLRFIKEYVSIYQGNEIFNHVK
ncbi:hypothetical protein JXB01_02470 [Candidatus Micrarchaeota archaeon]|nr:hypothetical protein [Candidatus Micrarchaeota archaeon]